MYQGTNKLFQIEITQEFINDEQAFTLFVDGVAQQEMYFMLEPKKIVDNKPVAVS